jgi:hypothetical protein
MFTWLAVFIGRLLSGEKQEKATSKDWRLGGSIFLVFPVVFWLSSYVGNDFLDHADVGGIFLYLMSYITFFVLAVMFCFRWIPTRLLFLFAFAAWLLLVWRWGWHGK